MKAIGEINTNYVFMCDPEDEKSSKYMYQQLEDTIKLEYQIRNLMGESDDQSDEW